MRPRMDRALFLTSLALFALRCQGLEFTMDRDTPALHTPRATCGILLCVEGSHTAPHNALSSQGNDTSSSSGSNSDVEHISSMVIYRTLPAFSASGGTGYRSKLGREVASVTSQHPSVTRVSDGVKVDGQLTDGRAELRLDLVKQEDCQAAFTCQVRAVDGQGRQLVSTSHLVLQQQAGETRDVGGGGGWTPAVAMQLLDQVQRLDTKVALMASTLEHWEENTNRLEDRSEDKLDALKTRLEDRSEDKLDALKTRLEDDMKHLENRLEDKIGEIGTLIGGLGTEMGQTLDEKMTSLKKDFGEFAGEMKLDIDGSLNKISQLCEQHDEPSLSCPTPAPTGPVCNASRDLAQRLDDGFATLQANLQTEFQDLSSNIGENSTIDQALASAIRKVLAPKTCSKGMVAVLSEASLPYTVIPPGAENDLDAPVLCDNFTDGGGWIVIQRRAKGEVNFYRDWAEYKTGFGSLDGDFWMGNERIHAITSSGTYELRVDLRYAGKPAFAHYGSFAVKGEGDSYALQLGPFYQGTAGDSFSYHNGQMFSTHDRDNDKVPGNCAVTSVGAWWYNGCHHSNLNGQWAAGEDRGPRWNTFSSRNAVSFSEMKIRRVV